MNVSDMLREPAHPALLELLLTLKTLEPGRLAFCPCLEKCSAVPQTIPLRLPVYGAHQ